MASYMSANSDQSMDKPIFFPRLQEGPSDSRTRRVDSQMASNMSANSDQSMDKPIFFARLEEGPSDSRVCQQFERVSNTTKGPSSCRKCSTALPVLQQEIDMCINCGVLEKHKTSMKIRYESLLEGSKTQQNKTLLNRIYTHLYIIDGESEGVNEEHEVLQIISKEQLNNSSINCTDIFNAVQVFTGNRKEKNIRSVLTKGIAGIGKTVSVQKFILDWAEGKANQDVDLMFVLPFRELNLIKDDQYSLHRLLCDFHPELKDLHPEIFNVCETVFIFDGLDENRIPLNFLQCERVSDITKVSSVGVLMTNLIKEELLPSALIWVTSRPAAISQIPSKYIDRVTEILGFNDPQKEEYFENRISDQNQANSIISHIKTVKSLHIMCHIPVFCWITANILQEIIKQGNTEIPKTLTEMYSHFLLIQTNIKKQKYDDRSEIESDTEIVLKLAELAFKQLMKGNVMFYEEDLNECGIDVTEASVYSGICTEIFREESVLFQKKVFCFVHLSFQEFLAALYVFHCFVNNNMEELQYLNPQISQASDSVPLDDLLKRAVDEALNSVTGHLDLFLHFLLGLILESNQKLLQEILTHTRCSSENVEKTAQYIKQQIQKVEHPPERILNLFLGLTEMNVQSLHKEIQEYLEKLLQTKLSPGQCSTLAYMLQISKEILDELDLKKFNTSEEGYRRLVPAVNHCRKAQFAGFHLTPESCKTIRSALKHNSSLVELDLSNNVLQDSGVELLCDGLKCSKCELKILRLAGCSLTPDSCEFLFSALTSAKSTLKELDLSNNDLQDSGVEQLSNGLKSSNCNLEILRLAICNLGEKTCGNIGSAVQLPHSLLKELDLSNNDLQDSGVELLSDGLKSLHCKLEILKLSGCMVTEEGCSSLASALTSNPSHLKELDLTYNNPGESGVTLLSARLDDPHYRLDILSLDHAGNFRIQPGLRKYACVITLDPNTARTDLSLCEGNRKVMHVTEQQEYPDHPDRFESCPQVLSRESLDGRCYWEAEWSGKGAAIAMAYKGISSKLGSDKCDFGYNQKSWTLVCFNTRYNARHNYRKTDIPGHSFRVGTYLDWSAGTQSFYKVSTDTHTLTHLYTFCSTFTEPLHAGIGFWKTPGSSAYLCPIEEYHA